MNLMDIKDISEITTIVNDLVDFDRDRELGCILNKPNSPIMIYEMLLGLDCYYRLRRGSDNVVIAEFDRDVNMIGDIKCLVDTKDLENAINILYELKEIEDEMNIKFGFDELEKKFSENNKKYNP